MSICRKIGEALLLPKAKVNSVLNLSILNRGYEKESPTIVPKVVGLI